MVASVFVASSPWNRKVGTRLYSNDRTHVKDLENLNICHSPATERILVDGSECVSVVQLTMSIDSMHHAKTGRARPAFFHSSLDPTLD